MNQIADWKLLVLSVILIGSTNQIILIAQSQKHDIVELKTGEILQGTIIEIVPSGTIKISAADGQVYVVDMATVLKISKATNSDTTRSSNENMKAAAIDELEGANRLSASQRQAYERNKLSLELTGQTIGGIATGGAASMATWRQWKAYEGFNELSEVDFFIKVGYLKEAASAQSYNKVSNLLTWGGLLSTGLGAAMLIINNNHHVGPGGDDTFGIIGGMLCIVGVPSMTVGLIRNSKNWAPYSTVHGLVEEYNTNLIMKIKTNE